MLSKIFEKIYYSRLVEFFKRKKLFYELQFGFREGHTTTMALLSSLDQIISALERGEHTIGVFLDFSKAFDTVNHRILLEKLSFYGIRGVANTWLKSYLTNHRQFCTYNEVKSDYGTINCGVPQGSILGPLLFLIYINDLGNISEFIKLVMFADDSNLFVSGKNLDTLQQQVNTALSDISKWLASNRLSLNVKKQTLYFLLL